MSFYSVQAALTLFLIIELSLCYSNASAVTIETTSNKPDIKNNTGTATTEAKQIKTETLTVTTVATSTTPKPFIDTSRLSGVLGLQSSGAWLRGFYVFAGLSAIVIIYFVIKSVSLRRKRKNVRYGLLSNKSDMELLPLDGDDDEEEVFDASLHSGRR